MGGAEQAGDLLRVSASRGEWGGRGLVSSPIHNGIEGLEREWNFRATKWHMRESRKRGEAEEVMR